MNLTLLANLLNEVIGRLVGQLTGLLVHLHVVNTFNIQPTCIYQLQTYSSVKKYDSFSINVALLWDNKISRKLYHSV